MQEPKHLTHEAWTRQALNEVLTDVYGCSRIIQAVIISLALVRLWSFPYLEKP